MGSATACTPNPPKGARRVRRLGVALVLSALNCFAFGQKARPLRPIEGTPTESLEGTLVALDTVANGLFAKLDDGRLCMVEWTKELGSVTDELEPGNRVRVTGWFLELPGGRTCYSQSPKLELIGQAPIPPAEPIALRELPVDRSHMDIDWVELRFVPTEVTADATHTYMFASDGGRDVHCLFPTLGQEDADSSFQWVRREVLVRGILSPRKAGEFDLLASGLPSGVSAAPERETERWEGLILGQGVTDRRVYFLVPGTRVVRNVVFEGRFAVAGIAHGAFVEGVRIVGDEDGGAALFAAGARNVLPVPVLVEDPAKLAPDRDAYRTLAGTLVAGEGEPASPSLRTGFGEVRLLPTVREPLDSAEAGDLVQVTGVLLAGRDAGPALVVTELSVDQRSGWPWMPWALGGGVALAGVLALYLGRGREVRHLHRSTARLRRAIDSAGAPVALFSRESMLIAANERIRRAIGLAESDEVSLQEFCERYDALLGDQAFSRALDASLSGGSLEAHLAGDPWGAGERLALQASDYDGVLVVALTPVSSAVEEELEGIRRLSQVGLVSSGLMHDINNLLTVVHGNLGLARGETPDREHPLLDGATEGLETIGGLARRISGHFRSERQHIDLGALVGRVVAGAPRLAHDVSIRSDLAEAEFPCEVDPIAVESALLNVAKNALEAAGPGGKVSVRLSGGGGVAEIVIEDDGPGGLGDQDLQAFRSRKGRGRGLGLWMARRALDENDCELSILRSGGEGTAVRIRVPLTQQLV